MVDDILGEDPRAALIAYRELSGEQLPWLEQRIAAGSVRPHAYLPA